MNRKENGRIWWWLALLLVAGAALLAGYFIGMEKGREERKEPEIKKIAVMKKEAAEIEREPHMEKELSLTEQISGTTLPYQEASCSQIENDVLEFFRYLDKKNYVQHLESGIDTYDRFKAIIRKLSSGPPIPAGEGIDFRIMYRNIFHCFRMLEKNDLRLLLEIMTNEVDSLEMNLDMFYKWLMMERQCPDREGIRPSLDIRYQYAGFFLNTIGGRAYLFRRPLGPRLLISYYCLLIIHEADKRGKNSYGIDIFPVITKVKDEISIYPYFYFQKEYIDQLNRLEKYYLEKR
ncbi:MAG: hypothetical protein JRJ02_03920 [Deltaproteobacteria bacterium]|nr:hypothetical protein [Deltaproteobacteria bacterium]